MTDFYGLQIVRSNGLQTVCSNGLQIVSSNGLQIVSSSARLTNIKNLRARLASSNPELVQFQFED